MAAAGTPFLDLRENRRSIGMSSPIVIVTRGPIQVMALIEEMSPRQISAPTMSAAELAEHVLAGDDGDVDLSGQFARSGLWR